MISLNTGGDGVSLTDTTLRISNHEPNTSSHAQHGELNDLKSTVRETNPEEPHQRQDQIYAIKPKTTGIQVKSLQ